MNILFIEQLTVMASIGIYNWEKKCLQKLIFDLKLSYADEAPGIYQTHIVSYLDYTKISQTIINIINLKHFLLIEDVAKIVSNTLIEQFPMILKVFIKINKPGAIHNACNVGIYQKQNKLNNSQKNNLYLGWR